jgi:hypothetical protein
MTWWITAELDVGAVCHAVAMKKALITTKRNVHIISIICNTFNL